MLKVKLFYNYYKYLEEISLMIHYVSFTTKLINIFKNLIENLLWEMKVEIEKVDVNSDPRLKGRAHYFQCKVYSYCLHA